MNETEYALSKLETALGQLKDGVDRADDDLARDGVIQRFEFTFELLWKAAKITLERKGIVTKSPRDALVEAFRLDLIGDERTFLSMLEDRNRTSHIYNRTMAETIFENIRSRYLPAIADAFSRLKGSVEPPEA